MNKILVVLFVLIAILVPSVHTGADPKCPGPSKHCQTTTTTSSTSTTTSTTSTTTTQPSTTTTGNSQGCVGVQVTPRADLQPVMDANPAGSTFCLQSGVYPLTRQLIPKNGSKMYGAPGTILHGATQSVPWAIMGWAGTTYDVVVRGLIIEGFNVGLKAGTRWTVEDNEFRQNMTIGAVLNVEGTFRRNHTHHNGQYGFTGIPSGGLAEDNEIDNNNVAVPGCSLCGTYDENWDAGGTKFVKSDGFVMRGNYVHHNRGPGLWCDGDCIRTTYDANTVEYNTNVGIFHEISYAAVISNNIVRSNASLWAGKSIGWGGDICVCTSMDVEVFGNQVYTNVNGISLKDDERGTSPVYGARDVRNVHVYNNHVTMLPGSLFAAGVSGGASLAESNNTFEGNTYTVPSPTGAYWTWTGNKTWAQWNALGNDD